MHDEESERHSQRIHRRGARIYEETLDFVPDRRKKDGIYLMSINISDHLRNESVNLSAPRVMHTCRETQSKKELNASPVVEIIC